MSKHHHYHPNHSGNYHTSTKKPPHEADMMMTTMPSHHLSNGLRPNGIVNGDVDSNDTNNNYNKHHAHHKRSAGGSGEASSSKRTKMSVPSDKGVKVETGSAVRSQQSHYNIMEKLKELYKELKGDKGCKEVSHRDDFNCNALTQRASSLFQLNLSPSSFLLDKLVTRERLHTLIINLYPGNKGYSLAFRPATSTPTSTVTVNHHRHHHHQPAGENLQETPSWLYDNAHLLDALDAEELPPLIIDFCNVHCPHLFYNGAVIAQIRDYRQSYPLDICDIHYVLLRPTATSLWDEINGAVDTNWTAKERTAFESQLVLATAPPICLDPSPLIGIAAINATTERAPLATDGVRKTARRFLQVTKNRNNKLEKKTHYHQTELASHLAVERRGLKRDAIRPVRAPELKPPQQLIGVESAVVKSLQPVAPSRSFDWQPKNTERLTFETDRDNCQYRVRVELFERATSCEVTGQLTLERQKVGQSSGRMCPFKLSSPLAARRYVKEFMGIFTEEGRKFVKITHERETRAGREIMEMQTGEKIQVTQPKIQTLPSTILTSPSTSMTSPPPPALVATAPIKLTAPQRIITTARPSPTQQVVVLAQVKQESSGNQVIKNLLNQPRAPMTQTMVNGHAEGLQTVYLQVDQSNLIHMGSAMPGNLQVSLEQQQFEMTCRNSIFAIVSATHRDAGDSNANLHNERARTDRNTTTSDRREATSRHVVGHNDHVTVLSITKGSVTKNIPQFIA